MPRENWKEAKLLRWGMWWHNVKRFKWPPKITRITIWERSWGEADIMIRFKVEGHVYFTQISCNIPLNKLFSSTAKKFLNRIEGFPRKGFHA